MNGTRAAASLILPSLSLWRREVVRFLRQRSRVVGALATPVVFWLLIGSGLGKSFRLPGQEASVDYLEYFFPGTVVLIVLFTAIFSMISVIDDRKEGFLQGVLVSPAARSAVVWGKVLGSTTLALGQAVLFLAVAPLVGVPLSWFAGLVACGMILMLALALSALGLLIAWPMDSTQGFHAVMNLFLIPMWLLSGALFPIGGASSWVGWIMAINPLSYGVAGLRRALYLGSTPLDPRLPSLALSVCVTMVFAVVMLLLAARVVGKRS